MIQCFFEDGAQAKQGGLRHVTTVVMIVDNIAQPKKVLLEKRALSLASCPGLWAFPGGYLDRNERVKTAAEREVMEETGYQIEGELKFLTYDDNPERGDDRQNVVFIWLAQAGAKKGKADHESSEVKWFELGDIPDRAEWAFNHYEYLKFLEEE